MGTFDQFTVTRIPEELEFTPGLLEFLEDADVVPGRAGTITAASPDGTTTVEIAGRHIGIGAFYRAQGAVYTDDVLARESGDWAICGVSLRSPDVRDRLMPQHAVKRAPVERVQAAPPRFDGAIDVLRFVRRLRIYPNGQNDARENGT